MGAIFRQEAEFRMKGGGLEFDGVFVVVFVEGKVSEERSDIRDDREWWGEVLESEKESRVSESDDLDGVGEAGAER